MQVIARKRSSIPPSVAGTAPAPQEIAGKPWDREADQDQSPNRLLDREADQAADSGPPRQARKARGIKRTLDIRERKRTLRSRERKRTPALERERAPALLRDQ